jgi:predicted ATP-grasp superfamily ATP-dependent carboligase
MALSRLGFRVEAICPPGHPLRHTRAVARCSTYPIVRPLAGLHQAIAAMRPALVVPCDDRAVHHLHALCGHRDDEIAALIVHSLGANPSFSIVESRFDLLQLAKEEGIRVPPTALLRSEADLDRWGESLPWVIKSGMSWNGAGVAIVHSRAEALRVFRAMRRPIGIGRAVKRLVINGDGFSLAPSLARMVPEIIVQRCIAGQPTSTTMACWQGRLLAQLSVRALATQGPTGASTHIEVIDHPEMASAAATLAERLQLSGFHGLDFMLDEDGAAWLIEFNPRATQVCHLAGPEGVSLAEALVTGHDRRIEVMPTGSRIAFFPQAWRGDPASPLLRGASHDVPWEEPELVRDLMERPWPNRGLLARAWQHLFDPKAAARDYSAGAAPVAAHASQPTDAKPERRQPA